MLDAIAFWTLLSKESHYFREENKQIITTRWQEATEQKEFMQLANRRIMENFTEELCLSWILKDK